jgi:hypothetical protein
MSGQTFNVEILGNRYSLRSDTDPEIVRRALELAEIKIKDAERRVRSGSPNQVALLALLDLAEDYVRAKDRATEHRDDLIRRSEKLLSIVEEQLK